MLRDKVWMTDPPLARKRIRIETCDFLKLKSKFEERSHGWIDDPPFAQKRKWDSERKLEKAQKTEQTRDLDDAKKMTGMIPM